jgi:hypothetical protein
MFSQLSFRDCKFPLIMSVSLISARQYTRKCLSQLSFCFGTILEAEPSGETRKACTWFLTCSKNFTRFRLAYLQLFLMKVLFCLILEHRRAEADILGEAFERFRALERRFERIRGTRGAHSSSRLHAQTDQNSAEARASKQFKHTDSSS